MPQHRHRRGRAHPYSRRECRRGTPQRADRSDEPIIVQPRALQAPSAGRTDASSRLPDRGDSYQPSCVEHRHAENSKQIGSDGCAADSTPRLEIGEIRDYGVEPSETCFGLGAELGGAPHGSFCPTGPALSGGLAVDVVADWHTERQRRHRRRVCRTSACYGSRAKARAAASQLAR